MLVKILFTCVGRRVELVQVFRKAAERLHIALEIVGADMTSTAPALAFCDAYVEVPRISDPEYIPVLMNFCRDNQINAVIPTIDTDLMLLAQEREQFQKNGTMVWVSDAEKIRICRDKRKTDRYFRALGLAAPVSVDAVERYNGGYPAFIKPVDGSSSIGASRAENLEELAYLASRQLGSYVIQPYATGTEYTVDIFCDWNGAPIYITPRKRLAVRAGEVLKTEIDYQDSIVKEMITLIDDFKPRGAITVQLIRDVNTNVNHYIEINPRFGGGAPLSIKAGADSAEALLRCLLGEAPEFKEKAAAHGSVYSRYDQSVCVHREENTQVQAVVFDLDDTLYSEKDYVRSGYRAVARANPEIGNMEGKLWQAFLDGKPAIDTVLRGSGLLNAENKASCLAVYRTHKPEIHLYDGVREMLTALRARGIMLGILTDGRPEGQKNKLEALGLYDLVDTVLITDELGGPQFRKPNDIGFRVVQQRLNIPFEQIVYVGDNASKDFIAPKSLGMKYLHFSNPDGIYYEDCGKPQIGSVSQLIEAVMELVL